MDIDGIGLQFLNQSRVPFSTPAPSQVSGDGGVFADLLKKAQSANTEAEKLHSSDAKKPAIDKSDPLFELCMELETFLIKNLIKSMRGTIPKTNLINTGFAGEVYEDMLYDEYAKDFSRNASFGFAEMAYRELTRTSFGP